MIRRVGLIGSLAVFLVISSLQGQDNEKDKAKQATPADEYRAIMKEYETQRQEYVKVMQAAKTNEERQEAFKNAPKPQQFAARLLDLAKKNPKDAVAIDAIVWSVQNVGPGSMDDEVSAIVTDHHIQSPKVGALFVRQTPSSPAMAKLAREVLDKSPHKAVQRQVCLSLAQQLKSQRQNDEAEKLYQRIVDEFPDVDSLMQVAQSNSAAPSGQKAIETLIKDHITSPAFASAMQRASATRQPSAGIEKLLRAVMEKSDDRSAKGNAVFGLAQQLKNKAEMAQALKGADENRVKQYEGYYGADVVNSLKGANAETINSEVEKLLEQVVDEFGDVQGLRGTLGDAAKPDLFEIRFLAVGKTVPEVEAEDLDGQSFKLSDYRGKVVMIDFWGHW